MRHAHARPASSARRRNAVHSASQAPNALLTEHALTRGAPILAPACVELTPSAKSSTTNLSVAADRVLLGILSLDVSCLTVRHFSSFVL